MEGAWPLDALAIDFQDDGHPPAAVERCRKICWSIRRISARFAALSPNGR
jgi:hypothetical protein